MKHLLSLLFLFVFCLGFAQTKDTLSIEEQQRREKNIQTGNPFKKFGYKPKIHTLSKGKYLEFHDLDSIVKIGSFSYHVKNKSITGYSQQETKYSEATLRPEIVSRWFSPDPLSDEFPSWSPYHFVHNNPINMIDPTGLAAEWIPKINEDGSTTYIAEQGDTVETFAQQYGVTPEQAKQLIGTDNVVAGETTVSGQDVYNLNPYGGKTKSEVLKLNDWSDSQKNLDHAMYAFAHAKSKGNSTMLMTDYFKDVFKRPALPIQALGNINIEGENVRVGFELLTYSHFGGYGRNTFNASYAYGVETELTSRDSRGTILGGGYSDITNYKLYAYIAIPKNNLGYEPGLKRQRYINLTSFKSQFRLFEKYFEREIPTYNYISTKNFKN